MLGLSTSCVVSLTCLSLSRVSPTRSWLGPSALGTTSFSLLSQLLVGSLFTGIDTLLFWGTDLRLWDSGSLQSSSRNCRGIYLSTSTESEDPHPPHNCLPQIYQLFLHHCDEFCNMSGILSLVSGVLSFPFSLLAFLPGIQKAKDNFYALSGQFHSPLRFYLVDRQVWHITDDHIWQGTPFVSQFVLSWDS